MSATDRLSGRRPRRPVSFNDYRLNPKLDFVTIETARHCTLPRLDGTAKWPPRSLGKRLTIHDPTNLDFWKLRERLDNPKLLELEVTIDFFPYSPGSLSKLGRIDLANLAVTELIAKGLVPDTGRLVNTEYRKYLDPRKETWPDGRLRFGAIDFYDAAVPPGRQVLWGQRTDPVQIKAYSKTEHSNAGLPDEQIAGRLEVRLSDAGLSAHGLRFLDDLIGFRYRKRISRYFRFMKAADPPGHEKGAPPKGSMLALLEKTLADHKFEEFGVGPFLKKGSFWRRGELQVDRETNKRIGQALNRLEEKFGRPKKRRGRRPSSRARSGE